MVRGWNSSLWSISNGNVFSPCFASATSTSSHHMKKWTVISQIVFCFVAKPYVTEVTMAFLLVSSGYSLTERRPGGNFTPRWACEGWMIVGRRQLKSSCEYSANVTVFLGRVSWRPAGARCRRFVKSAPPCVTSSTAPSRWSRHAAGHAVNWSPATRASGLPPTPISSS